MRRTKRPFRWQQPEQPAPSPRATNQLLAAWKRAVTRRALIAMPGEIAALSQAVRELTDELKRARERRSAS